MTTAYDWKDQITDEGRWDQMRGKIREEWAEVTDQELQQLRGNAEQLVGKIKEKTGQTAETIETKLKSWMS